jgi:hypothetical protein
MKLIHRLEISTLLLKRKKANKLERKAKLCADLNNYHYLSTAGFIPGH